MYNPRLTNVADGGSVNMAYQTTMKTSSLIFALSVTLFASSCGGIFSGKKAAEHLDDTVGVEIQGKRNECIVC
jgi:hypothetical protein